MNNLEGVKKLGFGLSILFGLDISTIEPNLLTLSVVVKFYPFCHDLASAVHEHRLDFTGKLISDSSVL